jgi:ligand-binding SRPBCC domain-containing protein
MTEDTLPVEAIWRLVILKFRIFASHAGFAFDSARTRVCNYNPAKPGLVRPNAQRSMSDKGIVRMPQFETSVPIGCTAEAAFEFLIRPTNVALISPSNVSMKIIDAPERFSLGSRFEFHLGGFGPPQHVIYEISHFDPTNAFTETQLKGPLKVWVHEHLVVSDGNAGVLVTDRITFEPPGGMLGFLITEERIFDTLKSGFDHRHGELKRRLEQSAE